MKHIRKFVDDWCVKHRDDMKNASDGSVAQIMSDLENAQIELMMDGRKHQDEIDLIYKAMYAVIMGAHEDYYQYRLKKFESEAINHTIVYMEHALNPYCDIDSGSMLDYAHGIMAFAKEIQSRLGKRIIDEYDIEMLDEMVRCLREKQDRMYLWNSLQKQGVALSMDERSQKLRFAETILKGGLSNHD
ncbi:MAG: hypothetical protein J6U54_03625 [Clostridiales bacterium]|nr:hypothetical protein [Clostridiales bacterium]